MPKSKLNREDYKTAIPQLERRADTYYEMIEKLAKKVEELEKRVKELEDA